MAKTIPTGLRGIYIWRLEKCDNGDLDKIIAKCQAANIQWIALKYADGGYTWERQFSLKNIQKLQVAGIRVSGWAYDYPKQSNFQKQVDAIKFAIDQGPSDIILDLEQEWCMDGSDSAASKYIQMIKQIMPDNVCLAHAPFDTISGHQNFPYTLLGQAVDWVSPQAYWKTHGLSVESSTNRYLQQWQKFEQQQQSAAKPRLAGGSSYGGATAQECLKFEAMIKDGGDVGCLYWEYSQTPQSIFDGLAGKPFGG